MRNVYWGMILITLGVLVLLDNLDVVEFGDAIATYWPALLILWGISILMKNRQRAVGVVSSDDKESTASELFHKSSVFGNIGIDITSNNFKGGSVSTVAGDCDVDLTKAVVAEGEHWLRVSGVFGSVRIVLSKEIAVSVSAHTVFGEVQVMHERQSGFSPNVNYASSGYDSASRRLKILVNQVFGDVRIL